VGLTQITALSGLAATLIIGIVTIVRQREFEPKQYFSYIVSFLAGGNIPPSVYLGLYVFFPDPDSIQTKLRDHETHIFLGGLALVVASLMTLWRLLRDAYKKSPQS